MTQRTYVFEGGCVTYDLEFESRGTSALLFEADQILSFQPRAELVAKVFTDTGLDLCGAGAECDD